MVSFSLSDFFKNRSIPKRTKPSKKNLNRIDKNSKLSARNPGFTITEVIVTVGIIGILATISHQYYIHHYDITGKLASLQKLGTQALHQMQICLEQSVVHTGTENFEAVAGKKWDGCTTKALLSLQQCEGCSSPQLNTAKNALCMEIKKDRFKQCVSYYIGSDPITHKKAIDIKACVRKIGSGTKVSAVWPYKPCTANSDCKTGQLCKKGKGTCNAAAGYHGCE